MTDMSYNFKLTFLFFKDFLFSFSYFGIIVFIITILLSFAPKSIEAIFSSLFFTLEIIMYVSSVFFSYILMEVLKIDGYKNT